ncbi:MAG: hypothetical protein KDA60_19875 [Planctomycetales bacterium]|nr:hypothetical protein [Planctomycetales bacterium]
MAAGLVACCCHLAGAADVPRVRFEIYTDPGVSPLVSQRWLEVFKRYTPTGVRIAAARGSEQPAVERQGDTYRITGILTSRNQLKVVGGTFDISDTQRFAQWLQDLNQHTSADAQADYAFGLSAEELVSLHKALAAPLGMNTDQQTIEQLVLEFERRLAYSLHVSPAARRTLRSGIQCQGEFGQLSQGTGMAAVLQVADLVMVPKSEAGKLHLEVRPREAGQECWPVGWPTEETPRKLAPKLLDSLEVEIAPVALSETLAALESRIGVPFVFDRPALKKRQIDPAQVMVEQPESKLHYARLLSRVLYQAQLKYELRVDEAGKGLIWLTPIPAAIR